MKTFFIIIFFISGLSYSQDIVNINSVEEIDKLKIENKGNILLVNFWATWCKPCTEEFPDLVQIYDKYKDRKFKLILISLDFKDDIETKLKPFLLKNNVDFTTYYFSSKSSDDIMNYFDKKWDGGIPATFIFDKEGNLKKTSIGSRNFDYFDKEIEKLI